MSDLDANVNVSVNVMTTGRTNARMMRVSTLALCLEAGVGLAVLMTVGLIQEPVTGEEAGGGGGLMLMALPFVAFAGVLAAVAASAVLVLPVVLLGEDLARRRGTAPLRWQLALSAVAGVLLEPLTGPWGWLAGTVMVAGAALITRKATRQGYFVKVLMWGAAAVVGAFAAGATLAYALS